MKIKSQLCFILLLSESSLAFFQLISIDLKKSIFTDRSLHGGCPYIQENISKNDWCSTGSWQMELSLSLTLSLYFILVKILRLM